MAPAVGPAPSITFSVVSVKNTLRPTKAFFNASDDESFVKLRKLFGPAQIDQQIRQAIHCCWMRLPENRRNIDELERQIRRLVDRALRDVREVFDELFSDKDK